MHLIRRLALWLATSILFSSLILFVYSWVFLGTFADRATVKSWLQQSGAYSSVVDEVVELSQAQAENEDVTVDTKTLAAAANSSFTPAVLQQSAESFLDGTYNWLEGHTEELEFSIDLTMAKQMFADALTSSAEQTLQSLPVCPEGEVITELDPFSATCTPKGFDFSQTADEFSQSIALSKDFLPNTVITEQNALIDNQGTKKTISETLRFAPILFSIARYGTYIFAAASILAIAAIFWLASTRGRALFRVFRAFLVTAISLALFTFISSRSTKWLESLFGGNPDAQGFSNNVLLPIVRAAAQDITSITLVFTWIFSGISIALLITMLVLRRRKTHNQPAETPPEQPLSSAPPEENTSLDATGRQDAKDNSVELP